MAPTFTERTSGREPSGRFGVDMAEFTRTYVLTELLADGSSIPIDTIEVTNWIRKIAGTTLPGPVTDPAVGLPGGAGSLNRILPMCDPMIPSLFADIPTVRVVPGEDYSETAFLDDVENPIAVLPLVPGFAKYRGYEFDVPFSARPYALLPNSRMAAIRGNFFDIDGTEKQLWYYPEYGRYTSFFFEDYESRVNASVAGGMEFRRPGPEDPGAIVDGTRPASIPDMVIPDQKLIIRWYQVPSRYLSSPRSFLIRYKGFINQWTFCDRAIGSLLYLGPKIIRFYTPPQFVPSAQPPAFDGFLDLHKGSFFAEPLVDIELQFIYTMRVRNITGADPDPDAIPLVERPNRNWLDAPHNWMPYFQTRRYFYAHATTRPPTAYAGWVPYYLSIPHQILFQDPDVAALITLP
jgi:hypothetical protein